MTKSDPLTAKVATRVLKAMAYKRQTFKDRVEEHISGAILEFYKAQLAEKNGYTEWVKHWRTEVKNLLERSLVAALFHDIRGFKNRKKAFDEVVISIKGKDRGYRTAAKHQVTRDFEVRKLKTDLDDNDTKAFWALVKRATDPVFQAIK
jgi:hypothetical protein